ncbi:MobH family relaxase [Thiothrix unzii]|uniref:Helicase/relaxase domain-containing protein n=1 Tax=Thiothrix unzii TaxID=111769 RepID=A0A975FBY4_9GAMM|nr:MobH family relaxase [Thiothrix unzii]QTR54748.1 helicase/relaxase domain-containing protein [Thiothrix unzii]
MLFAWLFRRNRSTPVTTVVPVLPVGVWPILPAAQLLQPHMPLITHIHKLCGVPDDYWRTLYQPLLDNFAAFVQQTPASEAHHHCAQGGMLTHSLQVMKLALEFRKGKMLPPGAAAEDVNKQQHAWTFAIASAALLHDVGKPCSDQRLRLFNANGQDTHTYWQPLQGALQSGYYQVQFVRDRQYRTHELLPPLLARQLTPDAALSWLQQDFPGVFKSWLGYLSGQDEVAGVLGQIVTEADRQSVADDLSGSRPIHTQQIPTAKAKPLSQRLLTRLRFLLDDNQIPLNRPGAAGFFDGDSLWLVSKRVLDELRNHLEKEGQTGIPSRNDRLMDELQQHGILTPTVAGQAIWNATVKAGTMEQSFTLLRIPANTLWADPAQFPKELEGTITPNAKDGEAKVSKSPAPAPTQAAPAPTNQTVVPEAAPASTANASTDAEQDAAASTSPWGEDADLLPPTIQQPTPEPSTPVAPASQQAVPATKVCLPEATGNPDSDDTGERFLHWLSEGLRTGQHPVNTTEAFLHTVKEGVLLVSPRAFKLFAPDNWDYVQKRFTKLKLHKPAPNDSNIWLYHVRGEKKSGMVRGFLISNPLETLGVAYLPTPNKSLSLPNNLNGNPP